MYWKESYRFFIYGKDYTLDRIATELDNLPNVTIISHSHTAEGMTVLVKQRVLTEIES